MTHPHCSRAYLAVWLFTLLLTLGAQQAAYPCTTAVVSGKVTQNGRPILWKLRDTEKLENRIIHGAKGSVAYVALVNADTTARTMVWGGSNSLGFSIMNSASFNTNIGDTTKFTDQEGVIMLMALEQCATLKDFEQMLLALPKPWGLNANFGVIDAQGGAAYYETDNQSFRKFDANDPAQAPFGVIVRSNFSFTGKYNTGLGFIRYQTAHRIIDQDCAQGMIPLSLFTNTLGRCLINSLTEEDFSSMEAPSLMPKYINTSDLPCRYGSASNLVIEGVAPQGHPASSILWASIAFPLSTVSVPFFVKPYPLPPALRAEPNDPNAVPPLAQWGLTLMHQCYPISRGSGLRYMNITPYRNRVNGGFGPRVVRMEQQILAQTQSMLQGVKAHELPSSKQVSALYNTIQSILEKGYREILEGNNAEN